jgi:hypothetical protein
VKEDFLGFKKGMVLLISSESVAMKIMMMMKMTIDHNKPVQERAEITSNTAFVRKILQSQMYGVETNVKLINGTI